MNAAKLFVYQRVYLVCNCNKLHALFPLEFGTYVLYYQIMTRLWIEESLQVQTNSRGQPAVFQLDGQRYVVESVIQEWEVDTDWWVGEGRAWRRLYAIAANDGELFCVLSYDVLGGMWQLERIYD